MSTASGGLRERCRRRKEGGDRVADRLIVIEGGADSASRWMTMSGGREREREREMSGETEDETVGSDHVSVCNGECDGQLAVYSSSSSRSRRAQQDSPNSPSILPG